MKSAKTTNGTATHKRSSVVRTLSHPAGAPVRRVNRSKLNRLAGCWPTKEADRIASFIEANCEAITPDE